MVINFYINILDNFCFHLTRFCGADEPKTAGIQGQSGDWSLMAKTQNTSWRKGIQEKRSIVRSKGAERLIKEIQAQIKQGHQTGSLISLLSDWIRIQARNNVETDEIAAALDGFEIQTISGRGRWRGQTIQYLIEAWRRDDSKRPPKSAQVQRSPAAGKSKSG